MDHLVHTLTYACGHKLPSPINVSNHRESLYLAAVSFSCPRCCKESAEYHHLKTQVYVNMQRLSDDMSALVLEVTRVSEPLEQLLEFTGYTRRAQSLDELNPGGEVSDASRAVWRKEFWFAAVTNPFHVISLIDLVKDEAQWLREYLSDSSAVHFLGFANPDE